MSRISSYDSSSISALFSSIGGNTTNKSMNSLYSSLSDYGTIRSGAYGKLVKAYYKVQDGDESVKKADKTDKNSKTEKTKKSSATSKDSTKVLAGIESAADDLTATAKAMYSRTSNKVFAKGSDGDYNKTNIYNKVSDFVEDYNSLLTATGKSSVSSIVGNTESMTNLTKLNATSLKEIGIRIDSKNQTLSIDEETFKNSDMEKVKKLFYGTSSYGYGVATQAAMINSYAENEASKSNTYGSTGSYTYNYNSGNIWSDFF